MYFAHHELVSEPHSPSSGHIYVQQQLFNITDTHILDSISVCFRAVGTFARALDCSSSIRQPSLHMSAAAASRDITLVRPLFV